MADRALHIRPGCAVATSQAGVSVYFDCATCDLFGFYYNSVINYGFIESQVYYLFHGPNSIDVISILTPGLPRRVTALFGIFR